MPRLPLLVIGLIALGACGPGAAADSSPASTDAASTTSTAPTTSPAPPTEPTTVAPTTAPVATAVSPTTSGSMTSTTVPADSIDVVAGEDLVGRWAHYDVVAYEDGVLKTLIVSYGFNDFGVVEGELVDTAEFCFSEQLTDQPIETSISDAATQAIKPPPTPVEVDTVDGTLRIRRPASPTPVGIRLDDPFGESLPTDPDDPRIVDDDGDGNPGITVSIEVADGLTGELYIARREIFAYEAFLAEPDLLTGTVTDESEQLVIGASSPVFLMESNWVQHPDPAKSPVILQRVDEAWDCDRLARERDALFPPNPTIDW